MTNATDVYHGSRLTVNLALEPGELIKDGYFSLMDSVASIEVSCGHLKDFKLFSGGFN